MRLSAYLALTAVTLTSLPASAAPKAPVSLPKVTKWEMNYDEDACHLMARFGSGDDGVLLAMTRTSPSDILSLSIYGKMLKFNGVLMPVEVAFGNQAVPYDRTGVAVTAGAAKVPGVLVDDLRLDGWQYPRDPKAPYTVPVVTPDAETAATSITFKRKGGKAYRLETGSLAAPMAAMRTCTDDLLVHWGYDPKVQAALSKRATPISNPATWLRDGDFPGKALDRGHNGFIRFRLDVAETGAVTGCRILFRTNPDEFADLSCKLLMERAKMTPALDAAGKPVKSYYMSRIKWLSVG